MVSYIGLYKFSASSFLTIIIYLLIIELIVKMILTFASFITYETGLTDYFVINQKDKKLYESYQGYASMIVTITYLFALIFLMTLFSILLFIDFRQL